MDGPVGLLAGNDSTAASCLQLCQEANLRVPEDVAILGVDNSPLVCDFAHPTISSVDPRPRRVGYEAAALLDRLLHGETAPQSDQLVEPGQVVERGSTDMLAMADRTLGEAIRAVRAGALDGRGLKEILAPIPMSRSSIERGFKEALGRTPGAELRRVRLEKARTLLRETDLPIKQIASRCGFSTQRQLSDAFLQELGQRPTDYRTSHR
jgi:LacI family transcriptional regulator